MKTRRMMRVRRILMIGAAVCALTGSGLAQRAPQRTASPAQRQARVVAGERPEAVVLQRLAPASGNSFILRVRVQRLGGLQLNWIANTVARELGYMYVEDPDQQPSLDDLPEDVMDELFEKVGGLISKSRIGPLVKVLHWAIRRHTGQTNEYGESVGDSLVPDEHCGVDLEMTSPHWGSVSRDWSVMIPIDYDEFLPTGHAFPTHSPWEGLRVPSATALSVTADTSGCTGAEIVAHVEWAPLCELMGDVYAKKTFRCPNCSQWEFKGFTADLSRVRDPKVLDLKPGDTCVLSDGTTLTYRSRNEFAIAGDDVRGTCERIQK